MIGKRKTDNILLLINNVEFPLTSTKPVILSGRPGYIIDSRTKGINVMVIHRIVRVFFMILRYERSLKFCYNP